jgi:ABC-2 type transport system ATP-binding protein
VATLALDIRELVKDYGSTRAVDHVNLTIAPGEILGFLGPNGAGKSTTLRLALGLLRPTSGSVYVGGYAAGTREARARSAYVAGEVALWPQLTGEETLTLLASLHGSSDVAYRHQLIERFELDPRKRMRAYSKGNRQKVAIIGAFATRAPMMLLDEPTSGLDPLMERVFRECVVEARTNGQSILLSSHMLSEVEHLCQRVAMIRSGQVVSVANVADLQSRIGVEFDVIGDVGDLGSIPGVVRVEQLPDGVRVRVVGSPSAFFGELATKDIISVHGREASLEEVFLSFYDQGVTP